jgi:phage/plasmid primase-like uncharacterized protein
LAEPPSETATAEPEESTTGEALKRAGQVSKIVASTVPIAGTPGDSYLRSRGITAAPPECIGYRRGAFGQFGALVARATDAGGEVLAVQQIYLTNEGAKALLEVVKRTNKAVDGWSERAVVRLPGTLPVILAEGVETALSIWQATGRETWACLGIVNIGRAPVPEGAAVVIARDGESRAARLTGKSARRRPPS